VPCSLLFWKYSADRQKNSDGQSAASMTCLIYGYFYVLTLLRSLFSVYLLICYNDFAKPDITNVYRIECDIRMLLFLILISSVLLVWTLLTQLLTLHMFSVHYTVQIDVNLVYFFCTKLMELLTSILVTT
jgi:hypothetical protein